MFVFMRMSFYGHPMQAVDTSFGLVYKSPTAASPRRGSAAPAGAVGRAEDAGTPPGACPRRGVRLPSPGRPIGYGWGMCGRFTLTAPARTLAELFDLLEVPDLPPRYNVAPTQPV